jgi:hypothetical protein
MRIGSSCQKVSNSASARAILLRGRQAPQRMELHHDVHAIADRRANLAERLESFLQIGARDVLPVARFSERIEWPDLHPGDALLEQ